jgi:hypothetical protein
VYSGECLDLFKAYVIGKQILESDRTVFLTFATVWDMLNIWRALQAGYLVQLLCDVTSKASTAALNKLAFGVNMLGGHFAPWTCTLIPAESESEAAYSAAYAASKNATRAVMRLPLCEDDDCLTCRRIESLKTAQLVAACLAGAVAVHQPRDQRWVMKEKQDAELARSCIPSTSLPRYESPMS